MTEAARKIRDGDPRAIARTATGIENRTPEALALLQELAPFTTTARIVGITGPPGAGKSTLVDAMAAALRQRNKKLAILAVDPTSRLTGGAILGDRIRMQRHHADSGVFIRSMATRGTAGGVARATRDVARLLAAAGADYVLVETVGVGQDEIEIARLAQVTVVVLVPGMGDDVQAIKAGVMEIADVFVINKSDHPGADRVEHDLQAMLGLAEGRRPAIIRTVANEGKGVEELLEAVDAAAGRAPALPESDSRGGIDHLGIAVRNLDESLPFYEALGLAATHRETVDVEKVHLAMLPCGDSRIELLEPVTPDSPVGKFLERRGPGLHHVALRVPDLAAAVERLRARGARLLNEPRPGAGGHLYVFVHPSSAGGVLLELIQESSS